MIFYYLVTIVQIITEMLPISSSTHVFFASYFFARVAGLPMPVIEQGFDYFLHGPTLLLLLIFFRREWISAMKNMLRGRRPRIRKFYWQLAGHTVVAALLAEIFRRTVKAPLAALAPELHQPLALAGLVLTAALLVSTVWARRRELSLGIHLSLFLVALTQAVAQLPGISRLGSTYCVGLWLGFSPRRSLQLSFLYELPLIAAAFFVYGLPWVISPQAGVICAPTYALALAGAVLVAYGVLVWACRLALQGAWWIFGCYLVLPMLTLVWLVVFG